MRLRFFLTLCLFSFGIATLSAINITLTAGALSSALSNPATVTDLTLSGTMNAEDFKFINEEMTSLQSLDLSAVEIVAYSGQMQSGRTVAAAATIPFGALAGSQIKTIKLPQTQFTAIGECAFAASGLTAIEFPTTAIDIADGAFAACPNLHTVSFNAATRIGTAAFKDCTQLKTVKGSDKVTVAGDYAFYGCTALSDFTFGSGITTIGTAAFQRSALAAADMSQCSSLTSVGAWAFANNSALATASFHKSVAQLGEGLFFGCAALEKVTLPAKCYELPDYAFTNDSKLSNEDLLNTKISDIGRYALKGVSGMTKIVLPYTLNTIGDNAMEAMTSLKEIDASSIYEVPTLGDDVWRGVDQQQVTVGVNSSTIEDFKSTPQWQEFNFVEQADAIDDITVSTQSALKGCFIGTTLVVKAENINVKQLSLYNIAGALLATTPGGSETAQFETAAYSDVIYIVVATLSDNRNASLKIAR